MTETVKTRPGTAIPGRAAEQVQVSRQGHASKVNFTTAAEVRQIQISDFLGHGQENAVPRRHLRQLTGFSDRELRRRIEQERRNGTAICSDSLSGYYIAANEAERRRFISSMLHRAAEIAKTAAAIEGAAGLD